MRHCATCDIDYTGDLDKCPLCASDLTGAVVPSPFPCVPLQRVSKRARGILLLIALVLLGALVAMWIVFGLPWELGVAGVFAIAISYAFVRNLMVHSPNGLRAVKRYFLVVMVLALLAFIGTREDYLATFVIPSISLAAIVFDMVLLLVIHSRFVTEYAKYLLYDIVFGIVPLVLVFLGAVSWPPLSIACTIAAGLMLGGLLIWGRAYIADEARKLFAS